MPTKNGEHQRQLGHVTETMADELDHIELIEGDAAGNVKMIRQLAESFKEAYPNIRTSFLEGWAWGYLAGLDNK